MRTTSLSIDVGGRKILISPSVCKMNVYHVHQKHIRGRVYEKKEKHLHEIDGNLHHRHEYVLLLLLHI